MSTGVASLRPNYLVFRESLRHKVALIPSPCTCVAPAKLSPPSAGPPAPMDSDRPGFLVDIGYHVSCGTCHGSLVILHRPLHLSSQLFFICDGSVVSRPLPFRNVPGWCQASRTPLKSEFASLILV